MKEYLPTFIAIFVALALLWTVGILCLLVGLRAIRDELSNLRQVLDK